MNKKLSLILLMGILTTSSAFASPSDDKCVADLAEAMGGGSSSLGFTNYSSSTAQDYAYLYIYSYGGAHFTLSGKCKFPFPNIWGALCESQANQGNISCVESNGNYQLDVSSANGSANITVTAQQGNKGDIKIQYGTLVDYPGPYSKCDAMHGDEYCDG